MVASEAMSVRAARKIYADRERCSALCGLIRLALRASECDATAGVGLPHSCAAVGARVRDDREYLHPRHWSSRHRARRGNVGTRPARCRRRRCSGRRTGDVVDAPRRAAHLSACRHRWCGCSRSADVRRRCGQADLRCLQAVEGCRNRQSRSSRLRCPAHASDRQRAHGQGRNVDGLGFGGRGALLAVLPPVQCDAPI